MAEEEKGNKVPFWVKLLIGVCVVLILLLIVFPYFDVARGYIVDKSEPFVSVIKDAAKFSGAQLSETGKILTGEKEIFNLEGEYKEKKKTGIEIGEPERLFGKLGVRFPVTVWEFDEEIKEIDVSAKCRLLSKRFNDTVEEEASGVNIENGRLKIKNPKEKRDIFVNCIFDKDEIDLKADIDERNVELELKYSFPEGYPKVNLDVFVSPRERFKEEYIGSDLVFKELEGGMFKNYKSKVPSTMEFISSVEAKMNFVYQPLFVEQDNILVFNFENNDEKNKVEIKDFKIELPSGIEFKECEYFDVNDVMIKDYFKDINKELNGDDKKTGYFECGVNVREGALSGSIGQIVRRELVGVLSYDHILIKKKSIEVA